MTRSARVATTSTVIALLAAPAALAEVSRHRAGEAAEMRQLIMAASPARKRAPPLTAPRRVRRIAARALRSPADAVRIADRLAGGTAASANAAPPVPYCVRGYDVAAGGPCASKTYPAAGAPRGLVMLVASGGWFSEPAYRPPRRRPAPDAPSVATMAAVLTAQGYQVVAVEHTSAAVWLINAKGRAVYVPGLGGYGYGNIVQWYDLLRHHTDLSLGASTPLCSYGGSSGAHFALLLAAERSPDCVIAEAAPTDLNALAGGAAYPAVVTAFGDSAAGSWSPARGEYSMPLLLGTLADDPLVPASQMTGFAAERPAVRTLQLTPTRSADSSQPLPVECSTPRAYWPRYFTHLCEYAAAGLSQGGVITGPVPGSIDDWRAQMLGLLAGL